MTDKFPKLKKTSWIILGAGTLFFLVSLAIWIYQFPGVRYSFIYLSSDSDILRIENRFEPIFPAQGKIRNYIDELLVGPLSEHCRPVFEKGTKVFDCFQRGNVLYVNLSKDLLKANAEETDFNAQINLFKRNIFNNFRNIKEIEIFIDGNVPFENRLELKNLES